MTNDVFGSALLDYMAGKYTEDIRTFSSLDEEDVIPVPYLFREFKDMPPLEQKALSLCKGKVLDIGCGAGSHSLYLQRQGLSVVGLDASLGAVETAKSRGLKHVVHASITDYTTPQYNTLLILMNGAGLAGTLATDIIYMYEDETGEHWIPADVTYYGELRFQMEYKGLKSDAFPWLYIDYNTLERAAIMNNLTCELVSEGEHYDYLAKLGLAT